MIGFFSILKTHPLFIYAYCIAAALAISADEKEWCQSQLRAAQYRAQPDMCFNFPQCGSHYSTRKGWMPTMVFTI